MLTTTTTPLDGSFQKVRSTPRTSWPRKQVELPYERRGALVQSSGFYNEVVQRNAAEPRRLTYLVPKSRTVHIYVVIIGEYVTGFVVGEWPICSTFEPINDPDNPYEKMK